MCTARLRITRSSSSSIGFAYQSTAPRRMAVRAFSRLSLPVTMMTLVSGWRSTISSKRSRPSGPALGGPSVTSSVTMLGRSSRIIRRASSTVAAVTTSYSPASPQRSWLRMLSSSSTMRIFSRLTRSPGPSGGDGAAAGFRPGRRAPLGGGHSRGTAHGTAGGAARGHADGEHGALAWAAARVDRPAVSFHDAATLRQPHAQPALLRGRERLEQPGADELLAHAASGVAHLDHRLARAVGPRDTDRAHADRARPRDRLARVDEQVHEHASDL